MEILFKPFVSASGDACPNKLNPSFGNAANAPRNQKQNITFSLVGRFIVQVCGGDGWIGAEADLFGKCIHPEWLTTSA